MEINPYIDRWDITQMDPWDEDFFNMDGQAHIQISDNGRGNLEFGAVQVEIDGKVAKNRFEFSFQGFDEGDQVSGWGWVSLKKTHTIKGEIRIFQGDESGFVAKKL